jgi:hypothetical protein
MEESGKWCHSLEYLQEFSSCLLASSPFFLFSFFLFALLLCSFFCALAQCWVAFERCMQQPKGDMVMLLSNQGYQAG